MRRSERLAVLAKLLADRPNAVFSLSEFAERFGVARSTVSEDVAALREVFRQQGLGRIETLAGAAGGVRYVPDHPPSAVQELVAGLCTELSDPQRILPGGFVYLSDLIASPVWMERVGEVFAARYAAAEPEAVVTLETRGIPIALMTARALNVPLAIVRRAGAGHVSEGTVVSMTYVTASDRRLETMSLARRALRPNTRVLVVDDFMKAGATAKGLTDLVSEFGARTVGVCVLIATAEPVQKLVPDYLSLVVLEQVDEVGRSIRVRPSDWVQRLHPPAAPT